MFDLAALRKTFFDAKAVTNRLDPAVRRALSKFGAFTARRSRSSIKRRKGTAAAGRPPFAHQGDIKRIFFGYDAARKSVVIGPVLYGSRSGAPQTLEEGGMARINGKPVAVQKHPFMLPAFQTELAAVGNDFRSLIK